MTGPEHYRESERLIVAHAASSEFAREILMKAQVHATLALAAACALGGHAHTAEWLRMAGDEEKERT